MLYSLLINVWLLYMWFIAKNEKHEKYFHVFSVGTTLNDLLSHFFRSHCNRQCKDLDTSFGSTWHDISLIGVPMHSFLLNGE
jgi:hypothetical protein